MTWLHFINCSLLTFIPPVLIYRTKLRPSESRAFWVCLYAGLIHVGTKFLQMLAVATFLPFETENFSIVLEVLKAVIATADLLGMHFVLTRGKTAGEITAACVGVGWHLADSILSKLLPYWAGARGLEFDWKYMQLAIESNIALVAFIASAELLWLVSRRQKITILTNTTRVLVGLAIYHAAIPVVTAFLENNLGFDKWISLGVHAVAIVPLAGFAYMLHKRFVVAEKKQ